MSVLSPSLPPVRSSTTRFRLTAPCARARSDRKAGSAKPIVTAATPFFLSTRRVIAMSDHLVFGGADDQMRQAGAFRLELRVGACPVQTHTRVGHQIRVDVRFERRRIARQQEVDERLRT